MRLKAFIYLLVRDHLPFGTVEAILAEIEKCGDKPIEFSEEQIEQYAQTIRDRLQDNRTY